MKKFKNYTLTEYSNLIASKAPVPGGGSAAAYTAALGVSLIAMAAHYSIKKDTKKTVAAKIKSIIKDCNKIRKRLLAIVDLDATAYLNLMKSFKPTVSAAKKKAAKKQAIKIPSEVCTLCYKAIKHTPYLVKNGNKNLVSDIEAANEMLLAAFRSAKIMVEINS